MAARSFHDRVSDFLWGEPEPSPTDRKHLELVRASARDAGRQVEEIAMAALEAKMAGPGVMAPPKRGYREAPRWGGQYRRRSAADYDWYDALGEDEKKRLSERWFNREGFGEAPDEIAERIPIDEWLRLTRQADLGRAMASGKGSNPKRFGNLRPSSMIAGEPYDFAELHNENAGRAARHVRQAREAGRFGVDEGNRCQFRTRPDGTIYPLANTCRGAYVTSAPARAYAPMRPEDVEAFLMTTSAGERRGTVTGAPWQLLPALSADEFASLKADIAANGLRVPIVVDAASGLIVDGHHRQRALDELRSTGVKVADFRDVRAFSDDEERLAFVLGANLFRRHLDRPQRAELVAKLRDRGWSLRRIGEVVGAHHETVRADLAAVGNPTPGPERVTGRDAKTYSARRPTSPPSIIVTNQRAQERARQALAKLGDQAPGRLLALKDAERLARQATYRQLRATTTPTGQARGEAWELRSGDFADVLGELDPASVDMVLTDPPYTDDFEERWADLAESCARVLKPGAAFVAYSGNHNLPQVIEALSAHLSWLWHVVLVQPGQESRIMSAHVHNGHRDLLILTAGSYHPGRWLRDTLTSKPAAQDKTLHPWQQAANAPRYLVDLLCADGGLVVDPCCGSGTFGVVARASGRRFLGVDIDPTTLAIAAQRLAQIVANDGSRGPTGL